MPKKPQNGGDLGNQRLVPDPRCHAPPRVYVVSEVRLYREGLTNTSPAKAGFCWSAPDPAPKP